MFKSLVNVEKAISGDHGLSRQELQESSQHYIHKSDQTTILRLVKSYRREGVAAQWRSHIRAIRPAVQK